MIGEKEKFQIESEKSVIFNSAVNLTYRVGLLQQGGIMTTKQCGKTYTEYRVQYHCAPPHVTIIHQYTCLQQYSVLVILKKDKIGRAHV